MFRLPKTKKEARTLRYRVWGGNPKGTPYDETRCAYDVHDGGMSPLSHQCSRKNGKGPDGLYCGIHAKKVKS